MGSKACFKVQQTDDAGNVGESSPLVYFYNSPIAELEILSATYDSDSTSPCSASSKVFSGACSGSSTVPSFQLTTVPNGYINSHYDFKVHQTGNITNGSSLVIGSNIYAGSHTLSYYLNNAFHSPGETSELTLTEQGGIGICSDPEYITESSCSGTWTVELTPINSTLLEYTVIEPPNVVETPVSPPEILNESSCNNLNLKYVSSSDNVDGFCFQASEYDSDETACEDAGFTYYNAGDAGCASYSIAQHIPDQMCNNTTSCMIFDPSRFESNHSRRFKQFFQF